MKSLAVFAAVLSLHSLHAESLTYAINWPSGLNLGEATLTSSQNGDPKPEQKHEAASAAPKAAPADPKAAAVAGTDPKTPAANPKDGGPDAKAADAKAADPKSGGPWSFHLDLEASVPGFAIRDAYQSTTSGALCTAELKKSVSHGHLKVEETEAFDSQKGTATRTISTGGGGVIDVPPCAHDPLAFLQFARTELAHGRMAIEQRVIFGGAYDVRMELIGTETVPVAGKRTETDHVHAIIRGPSREYVIELYFARDTVRTPVLARIPLPLGAFTVELIR
jgi:hypothetical protein